MMLISSCLEIILQISNLTSGSSSELDGSSITKTKNRQTDWTEHFLDHRHVVKAQKLKFPEIVSPTAHLATTGLVDRRSVFFSGWISASSSSFSLLSVAVVSFSFFFRPIVKVSTFSQFVLNLATLPSAAIILGVQNAAAAVWFGGNSGSNKASGCTNSRPGNCASQPPSI